MAEVRRVNNRPFPSYTAKALPDSPVGGRAFQISTGIPSKELKGISDTWPLLSNLTIKVIRLEICRNRSRYAIIVFYPVVQKENLMSSATPSNATPNSSLGVRLTKAIAVLILSAVIVVCGMLMIGPQILVIVPVAIAAGTVFAFKRSSWSYVCFGYPLIFGLISAWIGHKEIPGYEGTMAFVVSIGLGLVGVSLIVVGLWNVLPLRVNIQASQLMGRR